MPDTSRQSDITSWIQRKRDDQVFIFSLPFLFNLLRTYSGISNPNEEQTLRQLYYKDNVCNLK